MSAIPFIYLDDKTSKYIISEEAISYLTSIKGCIHVASVCGGARGGKSALLNRVILNDSDAFQVGTTTIACTKGLYLYTKPVEWESDLNEKMNIVVIDSEGICSLDNSTNDVKIMGLLFLLSSLLIYNSTGTIDDDALKKLSLVTSITKEIKIEGPNDFKTVFPFFVWVCRDFALDLVNDQKQKIDANQYLEEALKPNGSPTDDIRAVLREAFSERCCFTMSRPVTEESDLKRMNTLPFHRMRPVFVDEVERFRNLIRNKIKPKQFFGNPCTSKVFITMAKSFVDAINNGAMPQLDDSLKLLQQIQDAEAYQMSIDMYDQCLENYEESKQLKNPENLLNELRQWKREAIAYFKQSCKDKKSSYLGKLDKQLQLKIDQFNNQNISKVKLALMEYSNTLKDEMEKSYHSPKLSISEICQELSTKTQTKTEEVYAELGKSDSLEAMWSTICVGFMWKQISRLSELFHLKEEEAKTSVASYSNVKQELQDKITELLKQIEALQVKCQEYQASELTLQNTVNEAHVKIVCITEECEIKQQQYIEENHTLSIKLEELNRLCEESKLECLELNKTNESQKSQLNVNVTLQLELDESLQTIQRLTSQITTLKATMQSNELQFTAFMEKTKQETVLNAKKSKELQTSLQQEVKALQGTIQLNEESHNIKINQDEEQLKQLQEGIRKSTSQCEKSNQEIKLLKVSKSEIELQYEALKVETEDFKKANQLEVKNVQSQYLEFQTKSNTKIRDLETKLSCGNVEMANCKRRLADCEEEASSAKRLKSECQRLQSDLESQKTILGYLEKDKIQKDAHVSELREQNSKLDEKLAVCRRDREMDLLKFQMNSFHQ